MNPNNEVARLANAQFPKEISALLKDRRGLKADARQKLVALMNNTRNIGILFKEWRGKEQMKFEFMAAFMRENAGQLTEPITTGEAEECIRISNRMPNPITELEQARPIIQQLLLDGSNEPGKKQNASNITSYTRFISSFLTFRASLDKLTEEEPVETWDDEMRKTAREKLKPAHDLYEKLNP